MAELSESDDLETYEPQRIEDLTYEDKKALESPILISEKRADQDGHKQIKHIHVTVGSNQRTYDGDEKYSWSSLMVTTDSIFLTGVIEANEHQAMSTIDIWNDLILVDNDEWSLKLPHGNIADLWCASIQLYTSTTWGWRRLFMG